jgi:hypothetical protein
MARKTKEKSSAQRQAKHTVYEYRCYRNLVQIRVQIIISNIKMGGCE